MKKGDEVRTNKRYASRISRTPREGVLLNEEQSDGTHRVRLEGFVKPQIVHKSLMEKVR